MRPFRRPYPIRAATPIYCYDTESNADRVIRDPMTVLLGGSALTLQSDAGSTDPYNSASR